MKICLFSAWTNGSSAETFTARTTGCGIGILHLKAALERVQIIQLAARYVECAFGIYHNPDPRRLDEDIPIGRSILQIHFILKSRTTATNDRNAQYTVRPPLFGKQRPNFFCRVGRQLDQPLIADSERGS